MSIFPIHTPDTAPEAARPILEGARRKFGFVPNLLGALAEYHRRRSRPRSRSRISSAAPRSTPPSARSC